MTKSVDDTLPDFHFTADLIRAARSLTVLDQGDDAWRVIAGVGVSHHVTLTGAELDQWACSCDAAPCPHIAAVVLAERSGRAGVRPASVPALEEPLLGVRPGHPPLPSWVSGLRGQQVDAVRQIIAAYREVDVVFLEGPPGAGKTLIADLVHRALGGSAAYVATTKTLQDQVARDFSYSRILKGRANYETLSGLVDAWGQSRSHLATTSITCADCTSRGADDPCRWCDPTSECPYKVAKEEAADAWLAVLNTSYALADWNKSRKPAFRGRSLVQLDECDLLPSEAIDHVGVFIGQDRMRRLGMAFPPYVTKEETWGPWVEDEAIPKVKARLARMVPASQASPGEIRERRGLVELLEKLQVLAVELPQGRWVYDGAKSGDVVFRPIDSGPWGAKLVWPHARRWLFMSASIVSVSQLAADLGLEGSYRFVKLPMTFPAHRRPVYGVPIANVTHKTKDTAWPKLVEGILGVLRLHPEDRVLVHTHSYALSNYLMAQVPGRSQAQGPGRKFFTYDNAREREGALAGYKLHERSVLFASSMDRGVDLPGDLCRVQIIAKTPWPNLADAWVKAKVHRTKTGQEWFVIETIRTVIQMTGRGMRSADDYCVTYILDSQFVTNLYRKHKRLFPQWWRDAFDGRRFPPARLLKKDSSRTRGVSTEGQVK